MDLPDIIKFGMVVYGGHLIGNTLTYIQEAHFAINEASKDCYGEASKGEWIKYAKNCLEDIFSLNIHIPLSVFNREKKRPVQLTCKNGDNS